MNNCHYSAKLEKLAEINEKVRLTLKDNHTYEGWIDIPGFGYGYLLDIPDEEKYIRFSKSQVKHIEIIKESC